MSVLNKNQTLDIINNHYDDAAKKNKIDKLFIITVLLLFPLPQVAIDMYLPSLPVMVHYFHTTDFFIQLTLTAYILSLGIAQLIYGPCSDKIGRKKVLLFGTIVFLIGNAGCIFVNSILWLLIFRVIQGVGMGCGFVVASGILGDCFSGKKLAKMTSCASLFYSLSPIFAPVVGGYIQRYCRWQTNFVIMTFFSMVLLIMQIFFLHETNPNVNKDSINVKNIFVNYKKMIFDMDFMSNVMCTVICFSVVVVFNIIGPFLLENILSVSAYHYGQMLFLVGVSYFAGTLLNEKALNYIGVDCAIIVGILIMFLSAIVLLVCSWLNWITSINIVLFTCCEIFALGFVFPNCYAKALELFRQNLGVASALIGSAGLIGASIVSVIVEHIHARSEQGLSYIYLVLSIVCYLFYLNFRRLHEAKYKICNF